MLADWSLFFKLSRTLRTMVTGKAVLVHGTLVACNILLYSV